MPRITRQTTTSSENMETSMVNRKKLMLGLGLPQQAGNIQGGVPTKRKADELLKGMSKKRAALGEITNAFAQTRSNARKEITKIISKGSSQKAPKPTVVDHSIAKKKAPKPAPIQKPPRLSKQAVEKPSAPVRRRSSRLNKDECDDEVHALLADSKPMFVPFFSPASIKSASELAKSDEEESIYESASDGESDNINEDDQPQKEKELPPGVTNFDHDTGDDPTQVSEYAMEIFQYYKSREELFRVPNYLHAVQNEVSTHMRAVLVDWLVEVQESFELNHETLYTAVKLLDLYLSQVQVKKENLQLIGATACLIASKIDERLPPTLGDFVYVCDDAYNEDDLKRQEIDMVRVTGFDLGYPLSYRFFRRYARVCGFNMATMTFGRYILELALMEYDLNVQISESKLAAAALVVTAKVHGLDETAWRPNLEYFSGYKLEELKDYSKKLHAVALKPSVVAASRKTIRTKYSHEVFHRVALKPIPQALTF